MTEETFRLCVFIVYCVFLVTVGVVLVVTRIKEHKSLEKFYKEIEKE